MTSLVRLIYILMAFGRPGSFGLGDSMIDMGNGVWDWGWLCRALVRGRVVFPSLDRPGECPVDPTLTPPTQLQTTGLAPVIDTHY